MAGVSVTPPEVLLSKRVQEMVINGEEPPSPYISRDDGDEDASSASASQLIPIIDLSLILSSTNHHTSEEKEEEELQKLKSALSSWGCFQAVGHGIPSSFLEEVRKVTRQFFEQPMEVKKKFEKGVEEFDGYGADPTPAPGQSLDWSDRLFIDVYPQDRIKLHLWPTNPVSFRDVLERYTKEMKRVLELVSKAMAKSLNLQEDCFLNQFGEMALLQARFNYYSRCQRPNLILGLKAHSDGSGYTIILQDTEVEGLQVLKDDKWVTVPTCPHSLFILMADQMQIMTNGVFKSPVHRVLTNMEKERISVAMFYTPELAKEIGPDDGLINQETPRLYKKVTDYAKTHWDYYQQGKRALHTAHA